MALSSTIERLRGMILSAADLQNMVPWPDALIEDYLNLFDSLIVIADTIDTELSLNIKQITANYQILQNDGTILMNANANQITVDLPLPGSHVAGQEHNIKVIDETFNCFVDPNGNLIDGDAGIFQLYLHESLRIRSDGSNFWIL